MSDMDNYLVNQIADAYEKDHRLDGVTKSALRENVGAQLEHVAQLRSSAIARDQDLARAQMRIKELESELATAMARARDAENVSEWRFEVVRWAVSQKAFKELAIRYGARLGLGVEEVHSEGNTLKDYVLEDKLDPTHGTNAKGLTSYSAEVAAIKAQIIADRGFSQEYAVLVAAKKLYAVGAVEKGGWQHAIKAWRSMAEEGVPEAQFNLAYCYQERHIKDISSRTLSLKWYEKAFRQGEMRSAQALFTLIHPPFTTNTANLPPDELRELALRQSCLEAGIAHGQPWAIEEVQRAERESEKEAIKAKYFSSVRDLHVGSYPHMQILDELAQGGHHWAKHLSTLARCRITIIFANIYKTGGFFSSRQFGVAWLVIENAHDSPINVFVDSSNKTIKPGEKGLFKLGNDLQVGQNPQRDAKSGAIKPIKVRLVDAPDDVLVYVPDHLVQA